MNQAFWKTYKSKVLQTLSGESEEDPAEEVGTLHGCQDAMGVCKWVGHGQRDSRSERHREDLGTGSGGGRGDICAEALGALEDCKQQDAVSKSWGI